MHYNPFALLPFPPSPHAARSYFSLLPGLGQPLAGSTSLQQLQLASSPTRFNDASSSLDFHTLFAILLKNNFAKRLYQTRLGLGCAVAGLATGEGPGALESYACSEIEDRTGTRTEWHHVHAACDKHEPKILD